MEIYIYRHIVPNGKNYIGQTCQNPKRRWGKNGCGYMGQRKFYSAIKKYGWKNICHEILLVCSNQKDADEAEKRFIKSFNSVSNGYNVEKGGLCGLDKKTRELLSKKLSEVNRFKKKVYCIEDGRVYESLSEAERITGTPKTTISKCCKNKLGKTNSRHWVYYEDYLKNRLNTYKAKYKTKRVRCVETGEVFDSCASAARKYGTRAIESCARGELITSCGYHWEFEDTEYKRTPKEKKYNACKKSVICLNDLKIFPSLRSAADYYNILSSKICKCCKGEAAHTKGLKFAYLSDYRGNNNV